MRAIHAAWWIAALKLTKVTLAAGCKGSLSPRQVGSPPQNKFNDQKFLNLWQPEEPPRVCHKPLYAPLLYKKLPHMCHTWPKWKPQIINATLAELWQTKRQPKSHLGNPSKGHIQTKFTSPRLPHWKICRVWLKLRPYICQESVLFLFGVPYLGLVWTISGMP